MLLQPLLQEYLIENGHLPLPAVGQLTMQYQPGHLQEGGSILVAPKSNVTFSATAPGELEVQRLINFISRRLNIPAEQAKELFYRESEWGDLSNETNATINLPELGMVQKEGSGSISFSQYEMMNDYLPPISLDHLQPLSVIEPVVPESETPTIELMVEEAVPVVKDYWWVWAIVITVISLIMIIAYYAGAD